MTKCCVPAAPDEGASAPGKEDKIEVTPAVGLTGPGLYREALGVALYEAMERLDPGPEKAG